MSLSSGLTLTDLSDYLAPSQICIKPVSVEEDPETPSTANGAGNEAAISIDLEPSSLLPSSTSTATAKGKGKQRDDGLPRQLKKAEITLNDCLACSGCITSAESVLVSLQSHEEVYRVIQEQPDLTRIMSIAPQSLASLAALHDLTVPKTLRALRRFFKQHFGFKLVFDTTFARSIALREGRRELAERIRDKKGPILSSACPGWICYAEKTHGELLPFISRTKSPQAVMGSLVKNFPGSIASQLGGVQVYHVSVMPCYDKKLEASRPDFADGELRDTDCVLTTGEVQKMLDDKNVSLPDLASHGANDEHDEEERYFPSLVPAAGTSSGGYLQNAIESALEAMSPDDLYEARLTEKTIRSDYVEYTLSTRGSVAFKAARCYGFRNLQNLVRKVGRDANLPVTRVGAAGKSVVVPSSRRPNRTAYGSGTNNDDKRAFDFVEIMACPSGCVNGGGQISASSVASTVDSEGMPRLLTSGKDWVARVETFYWQDVAVTANCGAEVDGDKLDESIRPFMVRRDPDVDAFIDRMTGGDEASRSKLLRTEYRAVESEEVNGLAVKW